MPMTADVKRCADEVWLPRWRAKTEAANKATSAFALFKPIDEVKAAYYAYDDVARSFSDQLIALRCHDLPGTADERTAAHHDYNGSKRAMRVWEIAYDTMLDAKGAWCKYATPALGLLPGDLFCPGRWQ